MASATSMPIEPPAGGFGVILADPPWAYKNWSDAKNGAASSQYATLGLEELAAIPVASWAAARSLLLCWATWPKLAQALAVVEAWGFDYVTGFPWVKTTPNTAAIRTGVGFWTQGCSEMVLIGRRGAPRRRGAKRPVTGLLCGGELQFWSPNPGAHSRKPQFLHEYATQWEGPYLELFARREVEGWTCWGLELGQRLDAAGVSAVQPELPFRAGRA